jgi:hypothetical protein
MGEHTEKSIEKKKDELLFGGYSTLTKIKFMNVRREITQKMQEPVKEEKEQ